MPDMEKIIYDLERCTCNEPNACRDCSHNVKLGFGCTKYLLKDALDLLKEQPEIVRCKDCKYWYFADNRIPSEQENVCGRNGIVVTPDWFCADGKRK